MDCNCCDEHIGVHDFTLSGVPTAAIFRCMRYGIRLAFLSCCQTIEAVIITYL